MKFLARKKILLPGVALLVLASLLMLHVPAAEAAGPQPGTPANPATSKAGAAAGGAVVQTIGKLVGTTATIAAVVLLARMVAGWAVYAAAWMLDLALTWNMNNILTNDLTQNLLYPFWGYLRDVANAFLILVLLWIAFGIIFNLERINSRRLLVRVILVGLLINFSFTLTTVIFSTANALAKPFANELKKADPAAKIMEITNLHTTLQAAGKHVEAVQNAIKSTEDAIKGKENSFLDEGNEVAAAENTIPQNIGGGKSIPGIGQANANVVALLGCNPAAIAASWGISCIIGATVAWGTFSSIYDFMKSFVAGSTENQGLGQQIVAFGVNPIIATILLLIGAFVMFSLAIIFMARGIAIMFLAILSPLAFLAAVIPGQEKYWKMWLEKLFNWSFFAPIAFFLLLFTFKMGDLVQQQTANQVKVIELQANPPLLFQYILFIGMLISSLVIAKYMGIKLAGTLMKMGEKWAWAGAGAVGGFAMGAARRTVLPRLGALGERVNKGLDTLTGPGKVGRLSPFLRGAAALPGTLAQKGAEIGRAEIKEAEKGIQNKTAKELKRMLGRGAFLTRAEEAAAVRKLRDLGDLEVDEEVGYARDQKRRAINLLKSVGDDYTSILKSDPSMAVESDVSDKNRQNTKDFFQTKWNMLLNEDEAAQAYMWTRSDWSKVDSGSVTPQQLKLALRVANGERLSQLARGNLRHASTVNQYLQTTPDGNTISAGMDNVVIKYFHTNLGQSFGYEPPPGRTPPRGGGRGGEDDEDEEEGGGPSGGTRPPGTPPTGGTPASTAATVARLKTTMGPPQGNVTPPAPPTPTQPSPASPVGAPPAVSSSQQQASGGSANPVSSPPLMDNDPDFIKLKNEWLPQKFNEIEAKWSKGSKTAQEQLQKYIGNTYYKGGEAYSEAEHDLYSEFARRYPEKAKQYKRLQNLGII